MDVAVNAAAGALKAFFADLPEPLIPYSLHPELVEAASKEEPQTFLTFDPRLAVPPWDDLRRLSTVLTRCSRFKDEARGDVDLAQRFSCCSSQTPLRLMSGALGAGKQNSHAKVF